MDAETGENFLDLETGEILTNYLFDAETGEDDVVGLKHFKIPAEYYKPKRKGKRRKKPRFFKADPQESQLITAVIYLLPTMVFFHPILAVVIAIIEIFLHRRSHRYNDMLQSENVYFQSPLHPIVKEFCGKCKAEISALKVTKLQDIKKEKLKNYIRRIVT